MTYALGQVPSTEEYRENIAAVVSAWQEGKERQEVALEWPQVQILICIDNLGRGGEKRVAVPPCTDVPKHVRSRACQEGCAQCWNGTVQHKTDCLLCFSFTGICIRGHPALCDPQGVLTPEMEIILRA